MEHLLTKPTKTNPKGQTMQNEIAITTANMNPDVCFQGLCKALKAAIRPHRTDGTGIFKRKSA